jgi:3-deoxy-D-manno-octulosonate 8-phosphate phosphatase (KDO 8-P phosphatase)
MENSDVKMSADLAARIRNIRWLLSDVDGVLTDGGIILDDQGIETKRFDVKDGHGIKLLQRAGIHVALITGRTSAVVAHRASELNIREVVQGAKEKNLAYETLKSRLGLSDQEIAYIGDDVVDISILKHVGVAFAVHDAVAEVKTIADYVTGRPGGYGAVREIAELILKTQQHWETLMARYQKE